LTLMPLLLRARIDSDLPLLADLWVTAWREAMPQIDFEARRGWFCAYLPKLEAEGALTLCAEDRNVLAGFVTFDARSGYLDQLAVAPIAQGTGIARALLDAAKARTPGIVRLDVNQDNARALRFYEREGFRRRAPGRNPSSGLATWQLEWRR
jgi:putative acetyltransferase